MAVNRIVNSRRPVNEFSTNRLEYFELVPETTVGSNLVLNDPNWHLFTLDIKKREAIFVKINGRTRIYEAPFLHEALFQHAAEVMSIAFSEFLLLAEQIAEPQQVIHLLSIGRCGSTLAHHLFHSAEGVLSISEPDTYIGLTMARFELNDQDTTELLRACRRFHFLAGAKQQEHIMVVKHHSQALFLADRIRLENPSAKFLFMTRDGESWGNSVFQMAQSFGFSSQWDRSQREMFWYIVSGGQDPQTVNDFIDIGDDDAQGDRWIAVLWAIHMIEYLRLWDNGFKMLVINYRELNDERFSTVRRMFSFCGLPTDHLERVLTAFDNDSQAGTKLAQNRNTTPFTEINFQNFRDMVAQFKTLPSPKLVLPSL